MQQLTIFDILDSSAVKKHVKLHTNVGTIVYFHFGENGEYTQFRNITTNDFFWSTIATDEFKKMFFNECKPIETFVSERITGFDKDKIVINAGDVYHLLTKKCFDGYLYEVNATNLKVFTKKEYPNKKFVYTKYHIDSLKSVSPVDLIKVTPITYMACLR